MINTNLRPLSEFEKGILAKLLDCDFQGKETIKQQLLDAQVTAISDNNYEGIKIYTTSDKKADVKNRVPVIGLTMDEDDAAIEILLHVVDGKVNELEFVRLDGEPLKGMPRLDKLQKQVFDGIEGNEIKYKTVVNWR